MPRPSLDDRVKLLGIRHHGPGSARSLLSALEEWKPDAVLIEEPSDLQEMLPFLTHPGMIPPAATLVYAVENPRWAAFYPFAEFSPEYQAIQWAKANGRPVTFIDLPASASLGFAVVRQHRTRVLDEVATAAGFDDTEDWWEHLVERRSDPKELFDGLAHLMKAVRETEVEEVEPEEEDGEEAPEDRVQLTDKEYEAKREAHMRRCLRGALSSHEKVAVICGAWHVPALQELPPVKQDDELLKGLPKLKVGMTVVPWTFERLTFASGYGAGVRSPEFYDLLWKSTAAEVPHRWLLQVARLIRGQDLDASPASVIEAIRLADALASLRGRPRPGLRELSESARSVLAPDEAMWKLIERNLIVGHRIGETPPEVPMPPLHADLVVTQKRLRMKVDDQDRLLELDLRKETDLERSQLLHRLALLKVQWGFPENASGKKGTFHENWRVRWRPELVIELVEAGIHGATVLRAASNFAIKAAGEASSLSRVAEILETILLANLESATGPVVDKLQSLSATTTDVTELMDALVPLFGMLRYGTVRKIQSDRIEPVTDAIFARVSVGLPGACVALDDESAARMVSKIEKVSGAIHLADQSEQTETWLQVLKRLAELKQGHPLLIGKAERLRFDLNAVDGEWLAFRLGQEASRGATALETAAFVEGLLTGSGTVLIHHRALFEAVDEWLTELDGDLFDSILPLVRRTFANFSKPERRQIGEIVSGGGQAATVESDLDKERAVRVLPVIRQILGLPNE